jgi:CRP-like cAMP-binding protein
MKASDQPANIPKGSCEQSIIRVVTMQEPPADLLLAITPGISAFDPCWTYSRAQRFPGPSVERNAVPLGTNAKPMRFKGMNAFSNWPGNRLLLALPSRNLRRLMPELEQIACEREQVLIDADSSLDYVFFPDSGVVSVVAVYADGSIIEMATVGREGCTGMQAFFGAKISSVRLLVQVPGSAAKMSRVAFTRAMESMPAFRNLMSAYIQAFLEQVMVSVACNGAHSLKQRLARWLLMMRDRGDDDVLSISQDLLAEMLGVQRPTITNAARELDGAGLIARGRRQVTILDRRGLMKASCECYRLVRTRVAFHLPKTFPEK